MPLYSSDVHSKAMGQRDNEVVSYAATEEDVSVRDTCMSWCYLFVHHAKVDLMEKILSKRFKTFIHKTTIYKNENKHIREQERPTISGSTATVHIWRMTVARRLRPLSPTR